MPDPVRTRTRLIVIQATPFCNVNCRYCYLPDRFSTKRIDNRNISPLERIARLRESWKWELIDEARSATTTWLTTMEEDDDDPEIDWEKASR